MSHRNSLMLRKDYGSDEDKILKTIFDKNEGFLRRHLVLSSSVVGKLQTTGVINEVARARMRGESNETQVNILMHVVRRSGMTVFRKFIEVLRTSMDGWIADVILDTDIADVVLSGKKYTLIDYFKKDADYVNNDVITGYPVISILPYNNSSRHLIPARPYVQLHEGTMLNLADMMAAIRDINQRGYGMVSSHQLNQISVMFDQERQNQEATLAVLKQEEDELQELLDQNHKEQSQTRKNQRSLQDIDRKLKQISQETSQLSNPGPRSYQARERLMQIQRIPRSRTVPYESN